MKDIENASENIRVYPSDYKMLSKEAVKRRTSIAQILKEKMESAWKYEDLSV